MKCERCGARPADPEVLHDYCDTCSKYLCPGCMAAGCCGRVPAESGQGADSFDLSSPSDDGEDYYRD